MQLYKGLQKVIPKRIQYCIHKCVQISLHKFVNKKNLILKIKKYHKVQNQFSCEYVNNIWLVTTQQIYLGEIPS